MAAVIWLGYQFWRLIFFDGDMGAIDLKQRYEEIRLWIEHKPVYEVASSATYPPASYIILWPLLGWLKIEPARWLWALTSIASLYWLIRIFLRESGATGSNERVLIALLPLATYGVGATIGNGQLILHLMPPLLAGLLLVSGKDFNWKNDLAAASLILVSFVKPSVSAPFFWIVLFVPGRFRPVCLLAAGYFILTLLASLINQTGPISLIKSWIEIGIKTASWASFEFDKASIHTLLFALGHSELNAAASFLLFGGLGFWVFFNRSKNMWLLIGVTAIVARFWTYHGWYDDVLILLPMVTLFRISRHRLTNDNDRITAEVLFAFTLLSVMAPGGRYLLSMPWNIIWIFGQVGVWLADLLFLIMVTRRNS
ncbi:MAG: glycosyltransferase 87 family protein [bacterium]